MADEIRNFIPTSENLILACLFSGIYDVNRQTTLPDDNYELVQEWAESISALKLQGVIFHNKFSEETCKKFETENIKFVKVDFNPQFNTNIFRYFVYNAFIEKHFHNLESIFVTDIADVVVVKNPFIERYFLENPYSIFCGDEPKLLNNEWMHAHSTHLRSKIKDYVDFEEKFANHTLLNCGIIGGNIALMKELIQKLCDIHLNYNLDNQSEYTGDMGAFNYIARTQFNSQLIHGAPVNTVFKMYENERKDCWFRHK